MKRIAMTSVMIAVMLVAASVQADVKLSGVFGNHMVIQQGQEIRIFGSATPGEKVTAELAGKTASATACDHGQFRVNLPALKADGKAHTLTVKGKNTVTISGRWHDGTASSCYSPTAARARMPTTSA